jgi:uncharacterized delta-60 repeat protein
VIWFSLFLAHLIAYWVKSRQTPCTDPIAYEREEIRQERNSVQTKLSYYLLKPRRAATHALWWRDSLRVAVNVVALAGLLGALREVHAAPGFFDLGFGTSGIQTVPFTSGNEEARAIAIQPDQKILLAGGCPRNSSFDFCLARLTRAGAYDLNFGSAAKVVIAGRDPFESATGLAILPDGKILVSGTCSSKFCVYRLLSNGTVDNGFADNGRAATELTNYVLEARAMALQADGRIVVVGTCFDAITFPRSQFCTARYLPNGSPDLSFAPGNGLRREVMGVADGASQAWAVAIQSDGKILVAGTCNEGADNDQCLLRYNANGTLDTSLSASGKKIIDIPITVESGNAVLVQPDTKIILAGACVVQVGPNASTLQFCARRYFQDGSPDTSFNGSGQVYTSFSSALASARAALLQPDGKLVLAGDCSESFCWARYNEDGSLDKTFGVGGKSSALLGGPFEQAYAIALQTDGRIVTAGYCETAGLGRDLCAMRLDGGPFGASGCNYDIDGDGRTLATTDLLILNRISRGLRGAPAVANIAFATHATRNTWSLVRDYLVSQCGMSLMQ